MKKVSAFLCACFILSLTGCPKSHNSSTDAAESAPCTVCMMYVTAAQGTGQIGGATNADFICNLDTNKPPGSYKAFIIDNTRHACVTPNCSGGPSENLDWVFKPNTIYIRPDGTPISATDASGLLQVPLANSVGTAIAFAWVGLNTDFTSSANTCVNWTSSNNTDAGAEARADLTTSNAIGGSNANCNLNSNLICVQQ